MKYYSFRQNNSGGYWIENDDVQQYVIVQAENKEKASDKLDEITENYSDFCSCCGYRWGDCYDDGHDEPMIWGEPLEEAGYDAIIYHADGRKDKFISE